LLLDLKVLFRINGLISKRFVNLYLFEAKNLNRVSIQNVFKNVCFSVRSSFDTLQTRILLWGYTSADPLSGER
jgi:hypothetical protein